MVGSTISVQNKFLQKNSIENDPFHFELCTCERTINYYLIAQYFNYCIDKWQCLVNQTIAFLSKPRVTQFCFCQYLLTRYWHSCDLSKLNKANLLEFKIRFKTTIWKFNLAVRGPWFISHFKHHCLSVLKVDMTLGRKERIGIIIRRIKSAKHLILRRRSSRAVALF